jgi:hypothetical protein
MTSRTSTDGHGERTSQNCASTASSSQTSRVSGIERLCSGPRHPRDLMLTGEHLDRRKPGRAQIGGSGRQQTVQPNHAQLGILEDGERLTDRFVAGLRAAIPIANLQPDQTLIVASSVQLFAAIAERHLTRPHVPLAVLNEVRLHCVKLMHPFGDAGIADGAGHHGTILPRSGGSARSRCRHARARFHRLPAGRVGQPSVRFACRVLRADRGCGPGAPERCAHGGSSSSQPLGSVPSLYGCADSS